MAAEKEIKVDHTDPGSWTHCKFSRKLCLVCNSLFLVKAFIILTSTSILAWQVKVCVSRYLQRETTTVLSIMPTGDATFIEFTICPALESAYKEDRLQYYGTTREKYRSGNYWVNDKGTASTPAQIHQEVTYNLTEILINMTLSTANQELLSVDINNNETSLDPSIGIWKRKYQMSHGTCFALRLKPEFTKNGIEQVTVFAKINVYIFLHYPGQFLDNNSMTKLYGVVGKGVIIDVAYEIIILTLEDDAALPCSSKVNTDFDKCIMTRSPKAVMEQVGCTVPYTPNDYPDCDRNNITLREHAITLFTLVTSNRLKELCNRPCSSIEVFTGLPYSGDISSVDSAYVKMYLQSTARVNTMVLYYNFVTMLAEIGGYTGLLLGISLVNLTRVIDKLIQKFATIERT